MSEETLHDISEQAQEQAATTSTNSENFMELLDLEVKPRTDETKLQLHRAVSTLAEKSLAQSRNALETNTVADSVLDTINAMIEKIDEQLTTQVNEIIHHEDFQQLEGSWRGLKHLVSNSETGSRLQIRLYNVSKQELAKTFKKYAGASFDRSPIFKTIYSEEFDTAGGHPYGCIIGDYQFDHGVQDVRILRGMSSVAAAAHAPFIAAAAPGLLQMSRWDELERPKDLEALMATAEYAGFNGLRQTEDARYLALTMPRVVARAPWSSDSNPVEGFAFNEDTGSGDASQYTWMNAAYCMGANINNAFSEFGWCTQIRGMESGGVVDNLPVHTFKASDGSIQSMCPTEISIGDRREAELSGIGLLPLIHRKNSDIATFISAASLQKPPEFADAVATANAKLSASLTYLFASSRFAHYLKCMVRDKIGSFSSEEELRVWLQNWINQYVDGSPATSTNETKARKPLAQADVEVTPSEDSPGYYSAKFYLLPHYQLEGLTASLRLVSKIPEKN